MIYRFGIGTKVSNRLVVDEISIRHVGSYDGLRELARDVIFHNLNRETLLTLHFPVGVISANGTIMYLPIHLWTKNGLKSVYGAYQEALSQVARETLPQLEQNSYDKPRHDYMRDCLNAGAVAIA